MDKEIIDKVMFDNFLRSVPTMVVDTKDRKTISTYGSIDVNDLMSVIDRLNKVPTYDELLKENKKQKEAIDNAIELLNNFNFKILMDNRTMYIRLKDLEQGKDLLKLLKEVSDE